MAAKTSGCGGSEIMIFGMVFGMVFGSAVCFQIAGRSSQPEYDRDYHMLRQKRSGLTPPTTNKGRPLIYQLQQHGILDATTEIINDHSLLSRVPVLPVVIVLPHIMRFRIITRKRPM